jgi:proteasome lid subunit RPN8/RPN11
MAMEDLTIAKRLWFDMIHHAEETAPEECCGLAAGSGREITRIIPVENVLHSEVEFKMAAAGQIQEMMRIEREGLELLAIYHSHPEGPENPSIKDIKQFMYPESYSMILSRANGTWSGRGFRIRGASVEEIMIVIPD